MAATVIPLLALAVIAYVLWIALRAQDTFSRLTVGGLSLTFFVYIVVNMGMVSGLCRSSAFRHPTPSARSADRPDGRTP